MYVGFMTWTCSYLRVCFTDFDSAEMLEQMELSPTNWEENDVDELEESDSEDEDDFYASVSPGSGRRPRTTTQLQAGGRSTKKQRRST